MKILGIETSCDETSAAVVEETGDAVRPWAIDVSSGVEARPGIKDAARMRELFAAIHAAEGVPS